MLRTFFAAQDGTLESALSLGAIRSRLETKTGFAWVDLESPSAEEVQALGPAFGFHPLALEDCLIPQTSPKIEEYDDTIFLVSRAIIDVPESIKIETATLFAFLTADCLVTVHSPPLKAVSATDERIRRYVRLLGDGPDRVLHQLLDHVVDEYFPVLDELDEEADRVQDLIFTRGSAEALERIFHAKQAVLALRRAVGPQREILLALASRRVPHVRAETQAYFRDIYDHALRIVDTLEASRDELTTLLDAHLSQISNRLSQVMKTLSVVAILAMPLTIVTSFFGMNFEVMPLIHSAAGVWIATGIMLGLVIVAIVYFRWKRWF